MPVSKFNLTFLHNNEQLSVIIETPIEPIAMAGPGGTMTLAEDFDTPRQIIDRLARVAKHLLPDGPFNPPQGFEPMHIGDPEAHPDGEPDDEPDRDF